ncbi:hypothetical protein DLM45_02920 [Hyphomicrobium methylovorum]|uniref:hypothetical protein n=1 Tax=Hyphomicrobium methylovorum TaxID=84 RepID=UPI0015E70E55|nr:hypothetical protein [Hyphomicrobium methylovorum]MBA2125176.1 hypothetical protein [Hyphomicrobium methylovorum]
MTTSQLHITIAAAVSIASFGFVGTSAAQGMLTTGSISIEVAWSGGYMGLGGGLVKAIDDAAEASAQKASREAPAQAATEKVAEKEPVRAASEPPRKRIRHKRAAAAVAVRPHQVENRAPVTLISETLDHTGLNISTLTARQSAR